MQFSILLSNNIFAWNVLTAENFYEMRIKFCLQSRECIVKNNFLLSVSE